MMNITFRVAVALLACAFFFGSCAEEADDEDTSPSQSQEEEVDGVAGRDVYVKCKVNGEDFLSKDDERFNHLKKIVTTYQLRGGDEETNSILLHIFKYAGEGTYDLSDPEVSASCQYLGTNPPRTWDCNGEKAQAGITQGKITLTKSDDEGMEGTFEFTAVLVTDENDKVTVTDGEFKLKY